MNHYVFVVRWPWPAANRPESRNAVTRPTRNTREENAKNKHEKTGGLGYSITGGKKKKGPRSPRPTGRPMPSQSLNNSYLEAKPTTPFRGCSIPWAWCSTAGDIPSASLGQPSWLLLTLPTSCPPPAYWLWGRVGKLKRLGPAQALFSNGQTTGAYQRRFSRKTKTRHHMGCSEEI